MKITFYSKDSKYFYSIKPSINYGDKKPSIWLANENDEGGQFNADEVYDVIYNALDKYFKENY